jgi:hypothetical protein
VIRSVALLATLGLMAACSDAGEVRSGPQSQSPSGGAALATPVTILPASEQAATDVIIVESAQPAPTGEINAGAAFGRQAGLIIAQAMFR